MITADTLIQALLEAVEVGDDGVYLKSVEPNSLCWKWGGVKEGYRTQHEFTIHHPNHGKIGEMLGYYNKDKGEFLVHYVNLVGHPHYRDQHDRPRDLFNNVKYGTDKYEGVSRTLIRAGLRSLMKHIPGLKTIVGLHRITGTHAISARGGDGPSSNTSIKIPKSMRPSL